MKQVIKQWQLKAKGSRMEPSKMGLHQSVSMVIDLEYVFVWLHCASVALLGLGTVMKCLPAALKVGAFP